MKRWQILVLLLVVAFIPYATALVTGQNLGPTEHIQTMVTPDAPKPDYGWDILQADGVIQFLPWRDLVFDSWRHGEAPMLNPYQLAGQPLTANSQSGGFYPLHILFAFLPGTTGFKVILLGILHLFIAGAGLYVLLRNLKVSETGALLGATGFAMSQFMVSWAPLASVPTTVAWIPWVLAGILCSNSKLGFFQVSIATAMMLLAGHLQFAFYGLFAAFLMCIWHIVRTKQVFALLPLAAMSVGLVVAYPQVSLVLKNSQTSHRRNEPTAEGYEGYKKGVLAPFEALNIISPKFMGDPSVKNAELGDSGVVTGYWPMQIKAGANPAESALWVSPVVLTLALVGFLIRRRNDGEEDPSVMPAVVLTVLGVLLAFGSPLNQLLFFNFPGWSATGSAGRAHVLIVLGLCIAGAIGFDRLNFKNDGSKKWLAIGLVPLVLLGLGFNVMNMLGGMLGPAGDDTLGKIIAVTTKPHLAGIALSALLGSVVLLLMASKKLPGLAFVPAAILAVTLVGQRPLSGAPLTLPTSTTEAQERTVFISRNWDMAKTPTAQMPPNIASLARVHDLFGYDSILDKGFVEKLKSALGEDPAPPQNGNMMLLRSKSPNSLQDGQISGLHQLGVKDPEFGPIGGESIDTRIESNEPSTKIAYDGYDHQVIECQPGTTEILIRDRFYDGMTSPTPNITVENKDGWRHIKSDGKQTSIRIDYPGRRNYIGVIIGLTILLLGLVLTHRKHESDSANA